MTEPTPPGPAFALKRRPRFVAIDRAPMPSDVQRRLERSPSGFVTGVIDPAGFARELGAEHDRRRRGGRDCLVASISLFEIPGIRHRWGSGAAFDVITELTTLVVGTLVGNDLVTISEDGEILVMARESPIPDSIERIELVCAAITGRRFDQRGERIAAHSFGRSRHPRRRRRCIRRDPPRDRCPRGRRRASRSQGSSLGGGDVGRHRTTRSRTPPASRVGFDRSASVYAVADPGDLRAGPRRAVLGVLDVRRGHRFRHHVRGLRVRRGDAGVDGFHDPGRGLVGDRAAGTAGGRRLPGRDRDHLRLPAQRGRHDPRHVGCVPADGVPGWSPDHPGVQHADHDAGRAATAPFGRPAFEPRCDPGRGEHVEGPERQRRAAHGDRRDHGHVRRRPRTATRQLRTGVEVDRVRVRRRARSLPDPQW